ncbi:MAG: winged helix-turn-helix transcriptional regulator [Acidilobus sp.]
MRGAVAVATLAVALLALLAVARAQATSISATARIDEAGDLELYTVYNVTSAPALLVVPAKSPAAYFAVENGTTELPVQYNGTDLLVAVDQPGIVNVSYLTLQATSKEGALWEANFTMPCPGDVFLPPQSTPIYVSPVPQQVFYVNGSPALVMPSGPVTIEYMMSPPVSTTTTVVAHSVTTTSSITPTTTTTRAPSPSYLLPLIIVVVIVAAGGAGAALVMRRRGGGGPAEALDDRDRAILSAISKLGGEATASQVMGETNIPRSPLYRRLDKLVRLGYLEEGVRGNTKVYRCRRQGCS